MVLIFSMTEKNNKYKLLDESTANKIELIDALDDNNYAVDNPSTNDYNEITVKSNGDDLLNPAQQIY